MANNLGFIKHSTSIILLLGILICNSCSSDSGTSDPQIFPNHAPVIQSISADPATIETGTETILTCVAEDVDGDSLIITWTSTSGSFPDNNEGSSVRWLAPSSEGDYSITATVSDFSTSNSGEVSVSVLEPNDPPAKPNSPGPLDGQTLSRNNITLTWTCQDPEGDAITYDIYIGISLLMDDNELVTIGQSNSFFELEQLNPGQKYYWRVICYDDFGNKTTGDLWSFTTISESCIGTETVVYGGKTYNTVQIGYQCWLKQNLDIGTMVSHDSNNDDQTNNDTIEKYCYGNDLRKCASNGGLYKWNEAMQYVSTEGTQGICPTGWHIPTLTEYETLKAAVGKDGNALKRVWRGTGTNTSGFTAVSTGRTGSVGGGFWDSHMAYLWSSTMNNYMGLYESGPGIHFSNFMADVGMGVRCIKD